MGRKTIDIRHLTSEQKLAFIAMAGLEFDEEGYELVKSEKNDEIIRIVRDDLHQDVFELLDAIADTRYDELNDVAFS